MTPGERELPKRYPDVMKIAGGKRSWFGVDLREEGSSGRNWSNFYATLGEFLTSTYALAGFTVLVLLVAAYLMLLEPLLGGDSARKENLKALRLRQAALAQEKEILFQEAAELAGLEAQSPGWAELLEALVQKLPEGVWLSRVSLEEDKSSKSRKSGAQAEVKDTRLLMLVEGRVDARRFPSALEPVSKMIKDLKADPRFGSVVPNLELASTQASKEDPSMVSFELRGIWSPEAWKGKPQDRVRQLLSRATSPGNAPSGGKLP